MIVLSFDTDYMWEEWLQRFCADFTLPGRSTFFLWKPFSGLTLGDHELAPHPFLTETKPWRETLDEFENAWGRRASVLRPHSCAYAQTLGVEMVRRGYKGISQSTPLGQKHLLPYRHPWGLWELPIYYMDSMDMTFARNWPHLGHRPFAPELLETAIGDAASVYVFDFHPLHVALNTSSYDQYQTVRGKIVESRISPFDLAFPGYGCRDFFERLLDAMKARAIASVACEDVIQRLERGDA